MQLPYGLSAYSRANGRLPAVRLINLYPETSPTSEGGHVLLPRPGLALEYAVGTNGRGLYSAEGVLGGDLIVVSGEVVYRGEDSIGAAEGSDRVEFTYTVDGFFILSGGVVYQSDGFTVVATDFPDDAPVASITSIDNILVAVRADTGTIYFRVAGDTIWAPLDFFSAEREPDPAICVRALADVLWVFGTSTIEPFQPTGDVSVPFQRIEGSSITRGIKDRDSVVRLDNTLFFVGENNTAYRIDGVPKEVSNNGIAAQIGKSTTASGWVFALDGHEFFVLNLDDETICYDASTQQWFTLEWPITLGLFDGNVTYGLAANGNVYTLRDQPDDEGADFLRLFTALAPTSNPVACDAIEIETSPGTASIGQEATCQFRWSDDQSRTWTDWKTLSLGEAGQYRRRVRARRLGMIDAPGRVFEVRQTDPVQIRYSGVEMNPPLGGRSRG